MPRPIPQYVPGAIRDIVATRWPKAGMKGLAEHAGVDYHALINAFRRSGNRTLLKMYALCRKVDIPMGRAVVLLRLPEAQRRDRFKKLIYKRYESIQDLYRKEGGSFSDFYIESIFRGEAGGYILSFYIPVARSLGLTLEALAELLKNKPKRRVS